MDTLGTSAYRTIQFSTRISLTYSIHNNNIIYEKIRRIIDILSLTIENHYIIIIINNEGDFFNVFFFWLSNNIYIRNILIIMKFILYCNFLDRNSYPSTTPRWQLPYNALLFEISLRVTAQKRSLIELKVFIFSLLHYIISYADHPLFNGTDDNASDSVTILIPIYYMFRRPSNVLLLF